MAIIPEIQDRLTLAYPPSSNSALFRAVQEGSFLVDHLFEGESFLKNAIGRDLRGHLRRVGICHQIALYCQRGDLPFIATMQPMPKGNWHWLEIVSTGALAHVCRTDDTYKFPVEADSRQDFRLRLQPDLLSWREDERDIKKIIREIPKLYAWLTFRIAQDGKVSHLCWAAPAVDTDEYIAHINVLKTLETSRSIPEVSMTPDPAEALRLKDHIAKAIDIKSPDKKAGA
ncbi:MAG: hypothetical protein U1E25_08895 [Methylocystis sp.]